MQMMLSFGFIVHGPADRGDGPALEKGGVLSYVNLSWCSQIDQRFKKTNWSNIDSDADNKPAGRGGHQKDNLNTEEEGKTSWHLGYKRFSYKCTHAHYVNLLFKLGRQYHSSQASSQMLVKNHTDALLLKNEVLVEKILRCFSFMNHNLHKPSS